MTWKSMRKVVLIKLWWASDRDLFCNQLNKLIARVDLLKAENTKLSEQGWMGGVASIILIYVSPCGEQYGSVVPKCFR